MADSKVIVFLDFDGVLHPINARGDGHFCYMEDFLDLMDEFPSIEIVISSSWRSAMDFGVLKSMLDRHGDKVIGTTRDIMKPKDGYWRMHEILGWIEDHEYQGKWIAIDDSGREFPHDYPNLFLTESNIGLDEDAMFELRHRLKKLIR